MDNPMEQSRGYAALGLLDEALACANQALDTDYAKDAILTWKVMLAFKSGNFHLAAKRGCQCLAAGAKRSLLRDYTALALHHIGRSSEAAELLLDIEESCRDSWTSYHLACVLAAEGDCKLATGCLLTSLPAYRGERGKTWLDGDLGMFWARLARGCFDLSTAHLFMEQEFDILRDYQPAKATAWELDPTNYAQLPDDLRDTMRFDPIAEAFVLQHNAASWTSCLDTWARAKIQANQAEFDAARRIAQEMVLDAQPRYALAAWQCGDLCATRHHLMFSVEEDETRIADYFPFEELGPLVGEMLEMIIADPDFFRKVRRAWKLHRVEPDRGLEILDSLPSAWRQHPLPMQVRGLCLDYAGNHREGLELISRVCDLTPDDASPFLAGMDLAMRHGWTQIAEAFRDSAPAVAQRYVIFRRIDAVLRNELRLHYPTTPFRGQANLGGQILSLT